MARRLRWLHGRGCGTRTPRGQNQPGPRRRAPRTLRLGVLLASTASLASLASGCANSNGLALAREACREVHSSISLYEKSTKEPVASVAAREQADALRELRIAVQPAAIAAGEAPQWSALETTLSEANRVPEKNLVHALRAQCRVADSSYPVLTPPSTTAAS